MQLWSANHNWVARAAAWDREQDRVARQARLEEIEQLDREDAQLGSLMIRAAIEAMPAAARQLRRQPHALQEWLKTAVKIRRDALGIAEPAKNVVLSPY